jgi:Flp pilus assembly protein TadB
MNLLLLSIAAALGAGLTVLLVFLGVGRLGKNYQQEQQQREFLAALSQSEIELEREDTGQAKPKSWTGYWQRLAEAAGIKFRRPDAMGLIAASVLLISAIFGFFVWPRDFLVGLVVPVGAVFVLRFVLVFLAHNRIRQLDNQLPTLLSGLRASLSAQNTPERAIVEQAEAIPSPLGDDLKLVRDDINLNVPLDQALANFQARVPSREVRFLVAAIRTSIASGEDLDKLIVIIQNIVEQRQKIARTLANAIAGTQPALFVVGAVIPGMFLYSYVSSPQNQAFWTTPIGLLCLVAVGILYAAGMVIVRFQIRRVRNA